MAGTYVTGSWDYGETEASFSTLWMITDEECSTLTLHLSHLKADVTVLIKMGGYSKGKYKTR